MLLKLALRNIFRNKRRTLITIGAIAFAVFLSSVMVSFQKGVWDSVIASSVNLFFGYVQVHEKGFWDEQSLDNSMHYDAKLASLPSQVKEIKGMTPRLESLALASSGDFTHGVMVFGIVPELENAMTQIASKVEQGNYLAEKDEGALIAEGVAEKLKLAIGDTLVLISQGYHGVNAAGKFPVVGIFKYELPDLNKRMVYLSLDRAQYFYGAEDRVTSLAFNLDSKNEVPKAVAALNKELAGGNYEVMDYEELMPELVQAKKLDQVGGYIILGILYALITFAIFGTILMMTKERSYEFGVLTAIGMKRWQLFMVVFMENIITGIMGAIVGILMAIPIVRYLNLNPINMSEMADGAAEVYEKFGMNPIFPAAFELGIFMNQALIIFIISCILGIYPLLKILKLQPIKAMRD